MIPISTRIPQVDAEFLSNLKIQGATTPSEKLRIVIANTRKRNEGKQDYKSSLLMYQDMINNTITITREIEHDNKIHSELVSRILEWLPDMMAYVTSSASSLQASPDKELMVTVETGIADRAFRLMQSILQMGITEACPCYESKVVSSRMKPILDLVNVISKQKNEGAEQ